VHQLIDRPLVLDDPIALPMLRARSAGELEGGRRGGAAGDALSPRMERDFMPVGRALRAFIVLAAASRKTACARRTKAACANT